MPAGGSNTPPDDALRLQFGGAAGTLGSLGAKGPDVAAALAVDLGLPLPNPALPWHTRRGALCALGAALAIACGHAGKIARDVSLMMQFEIAEVAEPADAGRGGSSAMPHKRNPVRCMQALANATRAPGLVAGLLSGMVEEHERALGSWQAEWATWPALLGCTAGAVAAMADTLEGLTVDAARMAANFAALHGLPMTEAVAVALAPALGREVAHAAVERAARRVVTDRISLGEALSLEPKIAAHLDRAGIGAIDCPGGRAWGDRCLYRRGPAGGGRLLIIALITGSIRSCCQRSRRDCGAAVSERRQTAIREPLSSA